MVIYSPEMTNRYGRLYATNGLTRAVLTVSAGYFLYDAVVCLVRYEGMPFLVHGVFASILYTYGALSGYLGYYGTLTLFVAHMSLLTVARMSQTE